MAVLSMFGKTSVIPLNQLYNRGREQSIDGRKKKEPRGVKIKHKILPETAVSVFPPLSYAGTGVSLRLALRVRPASLFVLWGGRFYRRLMSASDSAFGAALDAGALPLVTNLTEDTSDVLLQLNALELLEQVGRRTDWGRCWAGG